MAQHQLVATWTWVKSSDDRADHPFEKEVTTYTADGYYFFKAYYPGNEYYQPEPEQGFGIYEYDGKILKTHDLQRDMHNTWEVNIKGNQLYEYNPNTKEGYTYNQTGNGEMDADIWPRIVSWENYRKLNGTWACENTLIKFYGKEGLAIIRLNDNPEFFKWGLYSISGNQLAIKEISAEGTIFYQGSLANFMQQHFELTSIDGIKETYEYKGHVQFDDTETYMVNQYMAMNHRLNMGIIDMMDGQQDYIWKRVDRNGKVVD